MRVSTSRKGGGARLVGPGAGPAPLVGSGSPAWRVQRRRSVCPAAPRHGGRGAPQKGGPHPARFCGTSPAVQIPLIYNKQQAAPQVFEVDDSEYADDCAILYNSRAEAVKWIPKMIVHFKLFGLLVQTGRLRW